MEINKIQSDLKRIFEAKNIKNAFNLEFEHIDEKAVLMHLLKKGFWSIAPIGFHSNDVLGIKLSPNKESLQKLPVVSFDSVYQECFTLAPDLKSVIPMANLKFMTRLPLIKELQEEIDGAIALSKPFFDYLGEGDLEFLKQFLFSELNQVRFENASDYLDDFYKEFWNYYYDTPEQKKAFELFEKLKENNMDLPDHDKSDYGVWNNYVRNVLANIAYSVPLELDDKWKHFWHCVQLPHGFDCDDNQFEEYKINFGHSNSLMYYVSGSFNSDWEKRYEIFPEEVRKHPIFEATEAIRLNNGYDGEKHIEAAMRLEEDYNDPIAAWNALVSASYWAGRAGNFEIVEQSWHMAIDLAKKHNWTAIHEVLTDQLAFYNFYKDKI